MKPSEAFDKVLKANETLKKILIPALKRRGDPHYSSDQVGNYLEKYVSAVEIILSVATLPVEEKEVPATVEEAERIFGVKAE